MNTKEVSLKGKACRGRYKLTVAVADYGRRLNLDRFRELNRMVTLNVELRSKTLLEVASACGNEGLLSLRRATPRL